MSAIAASFRLKAGLRTRDRLTAGLQTNSQTSLPVSASEDFCERLQLHCLLNITSCQSTSISMPEKLHGIVPPIITPLKDRDTLDTQGLQRLIERLVDGGVHGIFALGTTGEGPSLGYRLRAEVIDRVCHFVDGRVPVVVSVTDTAFVESVAFSKIAADSGADAVVLTTPYYFPAGQTELTEYVRTLVPELALPVMLYNMPQLTKVWYETETVEKLLQIDRVIGIKDSSGDMDYFAKVCQLKSQRPDWSVLVGPEDQTINSIGLGGDGGVNGGANVYPKLFVAAYNAAVAGDTEAAARVQFLIEQFGKIYDVGKYASRHPKATKCAASVLGICDDVMAQPFNRFYPDDRAKIVAALDALNLDASLA